MKNEQLETEDSERILLARMRGIEIFPGNLEEYERMKGKEYEIIDVPGSRKYLIGGIGKFEHLKRVSGGKNRVVGVLGPLSAIVWGDIGQVVDRREAYHEIVKDAAELGADAIIRYQVTSARAIVYQEMGIPVRRKSK